MLLDRVMKEKSEARGSESQLRYCLSNPRAPACTAKRPFLLQSRG